MTDKHETPFEVGLRINALRKGGDLQGAIAVARDAIRQWPGDVHVLRAYAWCRYEDEIREGPEADSPQQLLRAERAMRWVLDQQLSPPGTLDKYDPTGTVVVNGASRLVKGEQFARADELLARIDPAMLSADSDDPKYEPLRTKWFRLRTKCMAKLERWADLVALSTSPLRTSLSGEHVKWVEYRFSEALRHVGRPQEALDGIDRCLRGKNDSWIRQLRAEILHDLNRNDEAIEQLRLALADARDDKALGYLVGGLRLMAELLQVADPDRARAHVQVLTRVRQRNNWPIKPEDARLAALYQDGERPADDRTLDMVRRWWREAGELQRIEGTVQTVFTGGGSGFILADDGRRLYFGMPRKSGEPAPAEGTRVSFVVVDGFNKKKNTTEQQASKVRRLG